MLPDHISKTLSQLFSPPFRSVLWKSLGLTIALFFGFWFVLQAASNAFLLPFLTGYPWLSTVVAWLLGVGIVLGMGFLIAPITSVFAGVFLDDIAEEVEKKYYPHHKPGQALGMGQSLAIAARFLGLVLLGNFIALLLVVFLGTGFIIFFLLNGYLLGREYFQFAALRHMSLQEAEVLRQKHKGRIFISGLIIAFILLIPIVNLLTPLFAAAFMIHVYKQLDTGQDERFSYA